MRVITVLLACLGMAAAFSVLPPTYKDQTIADKDFLYRQKRVFELLSHVMQPSKFPEVTKLASDYNLNGDLDSYMKPKVVKEFWTMYKEGMLPKEKIFSISYDKLREEAIALFHVFYYAKDFETFYKVASWAREHVNSGMFVYSFTVAVLHRKDTRGIVLPPVYEIYPYFFVTNDVISVAQRVKQQSGIFNPENTKSMIEVKDNIYYFNTNYTGWYVRYNEEQRLSYFTEDIGLNSYYYYFHTDYPYWMGGEEYGLKDDRRGELYYFVHQQLLARYYLERLSNGLGKIPVFSWRWPVKTGNYPSLVYHNGLEFPVRTDHFDVYTKENINDLNDIDYFRTVIKDLIVKGFINLKDGTKYDMTDPKTIEVLGQLIQQNPDIMDKANLKLYKYYETLSRTLLGASPDPIKKFNVVPSVLEQYETALRDPIFWQLYKRVIRNFIMFKRRLTPYTMKELTFEGVAVDNVEVGKMETYFDIFEWDITNAVYLSKDELFKNQKYPMFYARQPRLNHKPFDVKIDITSSMNVDAVVRIFLGPKIDSFRKVVTVDTANYDFVEMDTFLYKLVSGKNTIVRNSREFWHTVKDRTTTFELYKLIMSASAGSKDFVLDTTEMHNGFPQRLLLPKGTKGGFPFQLYVIVSPWISPKVEFGTGYNPIYYSGVATGARYLDDRAFGYPFDRFIKHRSFFHQPNMHWETVYVYHAGQDYTVGEFNFHEALDYSKNLSH